MEADVSLTVRRVRGMGMHNALRWIRDSPRRGGRGEYPMNRRLARSVEAGDDSSGPHREAGGSGPSDDPSGTRVATAESLAPAADTFDDSIDSGTIDSDT